MNDETGGPVPAFPLLEEDGQAGHAVGAPHRQTARVLVGGIGLPWLRDLDFGTQFIRRVEGLDWPDDVAA